MRLLHLVPLCLLAACASTQKLPPAEVVAPADAGLVESDGVRQARVAAMFERETDALPLQTFTLAGASISVESQVPVVVSRKEADPGSTLNLDLGASQPMACTLFDEPFDVGAVVSRMLAAVGANTHLLPARPAEFVVIEKAPALFMDIGYAVEREGGPARGSFKLMVYSSDDTSLICAHDEPGYVKTFKRVAGGVAASLERARASGAAPLFRSVDFISTQGMQLGFVRTQWRTRSDGTHSLGVISAMVMPRTPTEWMTTDQVILTTAAKDGSLLGRHLVLYSNGEPDQDLMLDRVKAGTYAYKGTVQGKKLEGRFRTRTSKDLPSDMLQSKLIKEQLLSGKKAELKFQDYVSEANPTGLTEVTMKKLPGEGHVGAQVGALQVDAIVDAAGISKRGTMQAGPVTLLQERVFSEGGPPR